MQSVKFKDQSKNNNEQRPKYKSDLKDLAFQFALRIIKLIDILPRNVSCEVVGKQLLRSSLSIGANISEARASSSKKIL